MHLVYVLCILCGRSPINLSGICLELFFQPLETNRRFSGSTWQGRIYTAVTFTRKFPIVAGKRGLFPVVPCLMSGKPKGATTSCGGWGWMFGSLCWFTTPNLKGETNSPGWMYKRYQAPGWWQLQKWQETNEDLLTKYQYTLTQI